MRPAETRRSPVDLNTLLGSTLRLLAGRFAEAGISPASKMAPALPVVTLDPMLIKQALVNVVGNAIEASPAGGTAPVVPVARFMSSSTCTTTLPASRPPARWDRPNEFALRQ